MAPAAQSLKEDYHQYEGKLIAAIRFEQVDVFDMSNPEENNRFYSLFNRLHIDTQASTIAPQLLFKVGEPVSASVVEETERLLRRLPYLGNAKVYVDDVCGDEVALLVKTRDIWTTEPRFSIGREGGENKHGFGLSEDNIAGTGNAFAINYEKTQDRSSISYGFHSPHLFSSRLTTDISFTETSDGQESYFSLQSPFYSLLTPWAAGIDSSDVTVKESIRLGDETLDEYRYGREDQTLFSGFAFKASTEQTQRISLGLTQERDVYDALPETQSELPQNENIIYPWIQYHFLENRFGVYRNLNQMHRVEDVPMGKDLSVQVGYAGSMYGNDEDVWRFKAAFSDVVGLGDHHILRYALAAEGKTFQSRKSTSRALWGGVVDYYLLMGERHRVYASLSYHQGRHLLLHDELRLGGELGLRGYPLDHQRGDKRYLMTLEKRYISDWHILNVLRLGAVMYVDFGRAWGAGYSDAPHLSNVGFGLRLASSKAKVGNIMHLDLAFPLADKNNVDHFQWVIKATRRL